MLTKSNLFGILSKLSAAARAAAGFSKPAAAKKQLKKLFEKLEKVLDKRFWMM